MLKRNKHIFTYLLAFGITLAQCSIVFAEYGHTHHKQDAKCMVCQVADHLSHAVVSTIDLTLNIDSYAPMLSNEANVIHATPFVLFYLIRGPPLS